MYTLSGVILFTLLLAIILFLCVPLVCQCISVMLKAQEDYADAEQINVDVLIYPHTSIIVDFDDEVGNHCKNQ